MTWETRKMGEALMARQQIGHGTFGDHHSTGAQVLVDFGDASMLCIAQLPDERDRIKAKLAMRQGPGSFLFGATQLAAGGAG